MISQYPKTYRENLVWRTKLLRSANSDPTYREKLKTLFHRDIIFAFNAFFYTLDVRRRPEQHQPFCTWEYQEGVIDKICEAIESGKDFPFDKSRDMGATWMVLLIFLWFWLKPEGGYDFLVGSRIEDYVDKKGDMRTHFAKLRYALYRLPKWLQPKFLNPRVHDTFMKLVNPDTGVSITGESNNPNFSTQGRYVAVFFDEFAKWESSDVAAWTAAGDATPCRIPVSTPFGAGGKFYDLEKRITLHWSLHPRKAAEAYCPFPLSEEQRTFVGEDEKRLIRSPWYDDECERRTAKEIAQELDIDYIGAGVPVFDGRAGKRLRILLKVERIAEAYFTLDLAEFKLSETDQPRSSEDHFIVYRKPAPRSTYVLGVDVVEGVEDGDFASIKVINRTTKDVDGTYYSRLDEVQLARVITVISKYFTTYEAPWIGIETIGPGLATFDFCDQIHDLPNLFMQPTFDSAKGTPSFKKGWRTNEVNRKMLIAAITDWLLDKRGWADSRAVKEMTTFVRNKRGKGEAKSGCHDDEVLAFGIALQVDLIAPDEAFEEKERLREDGLSESLFVLEDLKIEDEGPISIEERCLATIKARKGALGEEEMFWNSPLTDPFNGTALGMG